MMLLFMNIRGYPGCYLNGPLVHPVFTYGNKDLPGGRHCLIDNSVCGEYFFCFDS